jgi:hypothetical protein
MKSNQIKSSEIVLKLERIATELKSRPFEVLPFWQLNREDSDGVICSIRFERGRQIMEKEAAMQLVVTACRGLLPFAEALSLQPGATLGTKDAVRRAHEALDALAAAETSKQIT